MPLSFELDPGEDFLRFDSPLVEARIIERPNRYVAQVALDDGTVHRTHVPVGGRIGGLTLDGLPCLLSGPYEKRTTDYTVEAIGSHLDSTHPEFQWIGIDQTASNRYVGSLISGGRLPELSGGLASDSLRREQMLGDKRIDFTLGFGDDPELWLEVKTPLISLTAELDSALPLKTDFGSGAPSDRMAQQFEELAKVKAKGSRVLFLGVFGYSLDFGSTREERYLANLNLDGLVDRGLKLGMEFWEIELETSLEGMGLSSYSRLFGK